MMEPGLFSSDDGKFSAREHGRRTALLQGSIEQFYGFIFLNGMFNPEIDGLFGYLGYDDESGDAAQIFENLPDGGIPKTQIEQVGGSV